VEGGAVVTSESKKEWACIAVVVAVVAFAVAAWLEAIGAMGTAP